MKLTLRQKNYRPFTVLFQSKNQHVHHLSNDLDLAREKIYRILDETGPTQDPEGFYAQVDDAMYSLAQGVKERRPTAFYCGAVCLTLE